MTNASLNTVTLDGYMQFPQGSTDFVLEKQEKLKSETEIIVIDSIDVGLLKNVKIVTMSVPTPLVVFNTITLISFLFFTTQLVLVFWGLSLVSGPLSLVAGTTSLGLFNVFNRVAKVIKRKNA